jgi:hypothetical protein
MSLETEIQLLKKDMAELTNSYYKVLKRNVELFEKMTNLEEDIFDLRRTATSQSNDSKGVERE